MLSRLSSIMKLSGLEVRQVDTTMLGSLWTIWDSVKCCGTRI